MPTITREAIVEGLTGLLGADKVDTDEQTLKENSLDRYRKLEDIFGIYNLPIPAAVVRATSTSDVAATLAFCNEHGINIVPKTGGTATEGGLETIAENSIVLDGKGMNRIVSIDEFDMQATVQCGVKLQDLEDQPIILPNETISFRMVVDRMLEGRSFQFRNVVTASDPNFIAALVRFGAGVAFQTPIGVEPEIREGSLKFIPLQDRNLRPPELIIAMAADRSPSPIASVAAEALRHAAAALMEEYVNTDDGAA